MNFQDYALALARKEMADKGINQRQLADLMGVSQSRVSQIIGVRRKGTTLRTLSRILEVMGVEFPEP